MQNELSKSIQKLILSRKFLLALLLIACSCVFLVLGYLTGSEFVTLGSIIIGAYTAANVVQTHIEKKTEDSDKEA